MRHIVLFSILFLPVMQEGSADEISEAIAALSQAGPEASGSHEAKQSVDRLSQHGTEILPHLLSAMDTPNIVAANWCRSAFERIVEREFSRGEHKFPREQIERFVRDATHHGRPRRLALTLLERMDPGFRSQMMPLWLEDVEFRSDAVAFTLEQGDRAKASGRTDEAVNLFRSAFRHARDSDQVTQAMSRLKTLGIEVNAIEHLGFIHRWYLTGPFAAPGTTGFLRSFPPEEDFNLNAEFDDGSGRKLRWQPHTSGDTLGQVNLIQALAGVREAVGYAYAEIESPKAQAVQLRCSADDNLTVWLNGRKVLAREQWLNGTRLDRFMAPVQLEAGPNRLLVKICQGPQHVDPEVPNNWSFQLRLCDETGGAVGVRITQPPSP